MQLRQTSHFWNDSVEGRRNREQGRMDETSEPVSLLVCLLGSGTNVVRFNVHTQGEDEVEGSAMKIESHEEGPFTRLVFLLVPRLSHSSPFNGPVFQS